MPELEEMQSTRTRRPLLHGRLA